jgi:hypothetical protein
MWYYLRAGRIKLGATHCGSEMERDDLMADQILSALQRGRYGDVCRTAVH